MPRKMCKLLLRSAIGSQKEGWLGYLLDNLIVVATTQSSVTSDNSQQYCLDWANLDQWRVNILYPKPLVDTKQNLYCIGDEQIEQTCGLHAPCTSVSAADQQQVTTPGVP